MLPSKCLVPAIGYITISRPALQGGGHQEGPAQSEGRGTCVVGILYLKPIPSFELFRITPPRLESNRPSPTQ